MEDLFRSTLIICDGFTINTDIFETNLINITFLIVGLVKFLGDILKIKMKTRHDNILDTVNDAEKRYKNAVKRLKEASTQIRVTDMAIDKIKYELKYTKINIIKKGSNKICEEIQSQTQEAKLIISLQEQKLLSEIKQQIITAAIQRIVFQLKNNFNEKKQFFILNQSIKRLGGIK